MKPDLREFSKFLIERFIQEIERPVILIGGPGCVGKSVFARELQEHLATALRKSVSVLDLDCYLIDREQRETQNRVITGYDPAAYTLATAEADIQSLLDGHCIIVSPYHKPSSKRQSQTAIEPAEILLIEGAMVLTESISKFGSVRIFMDASKDVLYENRKSRELSFGFDIDRIEKKFILLSRDYERFIVPQQADSEIFIRVGSQYQFLSLEVRSLDLHC